MSNGWSVALFGCRSVTKVLMKIFQGIGHLLTHRNQLLFVMQEMHTKVIAKRPMLSVFEDQRELLTDLAMSEESAMTTSERRRNVSNCERNERKFYLRKFS